MPRRPPLRLLALLLLAGCTSSAPEPATGPVDVEAPLVDAATAQACRALVEALPEEVDPGVARRPVSGDAGLTAAWGDPPVTLACGVVEPDRPEEPVTVNGVAWSIRDIGAGYRWTTRGREVAVAVDIPDAYGSPAEIVNPISTAIGAS